VNEHGDDESIGHDDSDAERRADPGVGIVRLSWRSTVGLAVLLAGGVAATDALGPLVAAVSLVMFFLGVALMIYTYAVGVRRSREELVTVPGLFLLQGVGSAWVRRQLLWSFTVQCTLAIVAASVRLYSLVAFGCLAPMWGLGLASLWAARHARFEPRPPPER
jgi:hypothetical protein